MKKVNWWIVGIIAVLAAIFLFGGGMMAGGWGNRGYGSMMGGYGMTLAPGASAGVGNWASPFSWFGMGLGMLFMWLIPVGVLTLIIFGVASLVQNNKTPVLPASQASCPNCGKGTQADWRTCPYCGTALK